MGAVGRPQQRRTLADRGLDRLLRAIDLRLRLVRAELGQVAEAPRVVRDLHALGVGPLEGGGSASKVLPDEERRGHPGDREVVEQLIALSPAAP